MVIQDFGCARFRNYEEIYLEFSDKINLFVGRNGQGKSNLAEGIYFLSHLDSFRTSRLINLIQFGKDSTHIHARIRKDEFVNKTRIELTKRGRKVWLNDIAVGKLSQYITEYYATVFNPEHLHGFRRFSPERRLFFDRYISFGDGNYLKGLREFREVRAQKNKLLKNGEISSLFDWNSLFVSKSYGIVQKRRSIVDAINEILPELYRRLTGRAASLRLAYRPSLTGDPEGWHKLLQDAAEKEIRAGHALVGPHRDDYRFQLGGGPADEFFSQGEYRVALLAMKLAATALIEAGMAFRPVLILDDLFSELDSVVRENLRHYLFTVSNQVFITSTEPLEGFGDSGAGIMEIRDGRIA